MLSSQLRVAVGLSGGVDSSVTALLLSRCAHTPKDLAALQQLVSPPPMSLVWTALRSSRGWSEVLPTGTAVPLLATSAAPTVRYLPFYMNCWTTEGTSWCPTSLADYTDAQAVARSLGLLGPQQSLPVCDFVSDYHTQCFEPMLRAYAKGRTLNIDVLCNQHIKFGAFFRTVTKEPIGATHIATGHYARVVCPPFARTAPLLARPFSADHDLNDQTPFLSTISATAVKSAIFPLGHLFQSKQDVRATARWWAEQEHGVWQRVAHKKTSTGLCFVGKVRSKSPGAAETCSPSFAAFLSEYVPPPPPPADLVSRVTTFIMADTGEHVSLSELRWGGHRFAEDRAQWAAEYGTGLVPAFALTLGQRVLHAAPRRGKGPRKTDLLTYYVCAKRNFAPAVEEDGTAAVLAEVRLVPSWNHPLLRQRIIPLFDVRLHAPFASLPRGCPPPSAGLLPGEVATRCWCSARHQDPPAPAWLVWQDGSAAEEGNILSVGRVVLDREARAITPGQSVVLYLPADGSSRCGKASDLCVIGSAWIK